MNRAWSDDSQQAILSAAAALPVPVIRVVIGPAAAKQGDIAIADPDGRIAAKYAAEAGTAATWSGRGARRVGAGRALGVPGIGGASARPSGARCRLHRAL